MKISIILPCRNEEQVIQQSIKSVETVLRRYHIDAEIIVSDSSSDRSSQIVQNTPAILVKHDREGYGFAYLEGVRHAKGKYLFFADSDGSYDFNEIPKFLNELEKGADFVIGNRFAGHMAKGAMPWMHRHIGNPILSFLLRLFFRASIRDAHCGMRAITREAFNDLNLCTMGMEFASEMIVKAIRNNLKIVELPIDYHKRVGVSKLRTFSDGWRHLRFMLLYSPLFLFFLPGILLFIIGIVGIIWFCLGSPSMGGVVFDYHPMFLLAVFVISGYQLIFFSFFAKIYAMTHLGERDQSMDKIFKYLTLERVCFVGFFIILIGGGIYLNIFLKWMSSGFGVLYEIKTSIIGLTIISLGVQTIFSSFMLSILGIKENR